MSRAELEIVEWVFGLGFRFWPLSRVDMARLWGIRKQGLRDFMAWKEHLIRCRPGKIENWVRGPWSEHKREMCDV
jgi:hypothetical protein